MLAMAPLRAKLLAKQAAGCKGFVLVATSLVRHGRQSDRYLTAQLGELREEVALAKRAAR